MKNSKNLFVSLAAPSLVLISLLGFVHRKDNDRVQAVPALLVGIGLISYNAFGRIKRRKKLLNEMLNRRNTLN